MRVHNSSAMAELKPFLSLWSTQSLSSLGSAMTSFALVVWSYQREGSALTTALLSVCSYAPYVLMSIFAGALSDRWDKRRTMIACGLFAALTMVAALALSRAGRLEIWHPYILNALNGLMNTAQQPASAVAVNLLIPEEHNQRVGGLQSLTNGLVTVLTPMLASTMMLSLGLGAALLFLILEGGRRRHLPGLSARQTHLGARPPRRIAKGSARSPFILGKR
ncbi:MAG: MFS transporter [Clostridiales bacterium]|nr:MFS transporter [Clostridiales bacterium]